jgi:hypothetical protein
MRLLCELPACTGRSRAKSASEFTGQGHFMRTFRCGGEGAAGSVCCPDVAGYFDACGLFLGSSVGFT